MDQMSLDDFLENVLESTPELLCCTLSQDYHWLRITSGYTPSDFRRYIDFNLDGYDYLYQRTNIKEKIISSFSGTIKDIPYSALRS